MRRRRKGLLVRFTPEELHRIRQRARHCGLPAARSHRPRPPERRRLPSFGRADFHGGALGALALYALALVAAGWLLTQSTAEHLGFDPALGAPWLALGLALPCRAGAVVLAVAAAVCLGLRGWRWGALSPPSRFSPRRSPEDPSTARSHSVLWWWRCRDIAELRPLFASVFHLSAAGTENLQRRPDPGDLQL